jgi:hypothetical protein
MALDIYFRGPGDPNFKDGIYQVTDDIENTIQQVRMTLLTKKGEVLGEPDFGFGMEKYLFEFDDFSLATIDSDANTQIATYVMMAKKYAVQAQTSYMDTGDENRVGLVLDVKINGETSAFAALFDV